MPLPTGLPLDQLRAPSSAFYDGPTVVLAGPNLVDVANLLRRAVRHVERRDGIAPPTRLVELLAVCDSAAEAQRAATSHGGHPLGAGGSSGAGSSSEVELLSTAQAATVLGLSARHVRRLVDELGGELAGCTWVFDRSTVEAYARASRPNRSRSTR